MLGNVCILSPILGIFVHGIKTSKQDVELIKNRFKLAEKEYEVWLLNRRKKL